MPGPAGGSGPASSIGGSTVNGLQGGLTAALIALSMLVLLRLARRAAASPIWRAALPEVPPA
jgi:hypothetical protein